MNVSFIYYSSWLLTIYTNSPGRKIYITFFAGHHKHTCLLVGHGILVHKRGERTTRYKVHPNQLNRLKRVEKLHHLKSETIFSEASQTKWCEPFHKVLLASMGAFASSI